MLGEIEGARSTNAAPSEERLRALPSPMRRTELAERPLTSIRGYAELWRQGGLAEASRPSPTPMRAHGTGSGRAWACSSTTCCSSPGSDQGRPPPSPRPRRPSPCWAPPDARCRTPCAVEPDRPGHPRRPPRHLVVNGDEGRAAPGGSATCSPTVRVHTPTRYRRPGFRVAAEEPKRGCSRVEGRRARVRTFTRGGRSSAFFRRRPGAGARRPAGGTGLGLSIVSSVVDAHGGATASGGASDAPAAAPRPSRAAPRSDTRGQRLANSHVKLSGFSSGCVNDGLLH